MKILLFLLASLFSLILMSQNPIPAYLLDVNESSASFGFSVASAGDVNGDGHNDLIVGAKNESNVNINEGAAYIYHGTLTGIDSIYALKLAGNQMSATFGSTVSSAGDLNGDGYDDIAVGAPNYDKPTIDEGAVFIYYGSPTGINPIVGLILESDQLSAHFGNAIAGGGDFNNDGYDDLVIGAFEYDNGQSNEGRIYIYMGSSSGLISTPVLTIESNQVSAKFGYALDEAGDINGDGFSDLVVGAQLYDNGQTNEGTTYIYYGSPTGITTIGSVTIEIDNASANFGSAVSSAGDLNNDGYDDVLIGAPYYNNGIGLEGAVCVYFGGSEGINLFTSVKLLANQKSAAFGWSVSECGDFDNDGFDDFIAGANAFDHGETNEGMAFLYRGSASGFETSVAMTFEVNQATSNFANALSDAGDINNDGFDDFVVGAYQYDNGSYDEGIVNMYFGSICTPSLYYQDLDGDEFGNSLFSINSCMPQLGFELDASDCNDNDSLINPLSIWYLDFDGDNYTGDSSINQCLSPGAGYVINGILGFGDCDDSNPTKYNAAIERVDSIDNNCDGIIDENLEWTYGGSITGSQPFENFGNCISSAGDINGDGFIDMIIAAEALDVSGDEGGIYILHGSELGLDFIPETFIAGDHEISYFGNSVSSAGDINNDGFDDIIVGAPQYTNGQFEEGRAYVYLGSSSGIVTLPSLILEADQANAFFGFGVANAGDINADGFDDILISAPRFDNGQVDEGRVYVYQGSLTGLNPIPTIILEVDIATVQFGFSVDGAGDINNDGYDDIIIGAISYENGETDEGAVYVYYGSSIGISHDSFSLLESNSTNSYLGVSVSDAGDVNNDTYDDIIAGAMYYSNGESSEGAGFLFLGSPTGIEETPAFILESNQSDAQLGLSVSSAGDINGDEFDDILLGAHYYDDDQLDEGGVFIYNGSPEGIDLTSLFILQNNSDTAHYGVSVCDLGDINFDGVDDIAVGAEWFYTEIPYSGAAFLYMHKPCDNSFYLDSDGDGFGDPFTFINACTAPGGYVINNGDCNDLNELIFPGSYEICNTFDDDCDGSIDEDIPITITIAADAPTTFCQGGNVLLTATYSGATVQWKKNGTNIPGATAPTYLVTTKATYTCVTTSACGSATSAGIFVNVNKNPTATITAGGPTTFCAGGSVILTANAGAGLSYQWYKGASLIAGATAINYTATIPGNYKCRVTKTATGCFKNSNAISVSVTCKEGEIFINDIEIYPNPADDVLMVNTNSNTLKSITILNNVGEQVKLLNNSGEVIEINIADLPAGLYAIEIRDGNFYYLNSFIKK